MILGWRRPGKAGGCRIFFTQRIEDEFSKKIVRDTQRKQRLSASRVEQTRGGLAQLGERLPCKQEVTSSNLVFSIDN